MQHFDISDSLQCFSHFCISVSSVSLFLGPQVLCFFSNICSINMLSVFQCSNATVVHLSMSYSSSISSGSHTCSTQKPFASILCNWPEVCLCYSKSQNQWAKETLYKGAQVVLQLWILGSDVLIWNSLITFFFFIIMLSHPKMWLFPAKG